MIDPKLHLTVASFYFLQNELKYPSDSLAIGQHGDEHFQADISIVDPTTERVLAFVELTIAANEQVMHRVAKSYRGFIERSRIKVPVYLFVNAKTESDDSAIFILSEEDEWIPIGKNEFPSLERLISGNAAQQKIEISKNKVRRDNAVDELERCSKLIFAMLLVVFIVPWLSAYIPCLSKLTYTKEQLAILLGACVVLLLPSYQRVRAFGVELERPRERKRTGSEKEE